MNKKVAFKTLGCRLNQYETDCLVSEFYHAGYQVVDFRDKADVYIINTCTVTNQSDKKSRNLIHQATRNNDSTIIIVTGCMVDNYKDRLDQIPGNLYYVDNIRKSSVLELVETHFRGEVRNPDLLNPGAFSFTPADTTFHTRSLIKIQDGCDHYCTYCIVPFVRGKAVSRPVQDIITNVHQVIEFGFREIVLTGVNIGRYYAEGTTFEDLVEKILDLPGDFRMRISSIEPEGFGDKLISLFNHPKLMPHLHLCLQSGSESILLKMRRMYSLPDFVNIIDRVKKNYPDFNFTTDIIVGFPGESDEDFNMTCKIVKEIGFSHIHTFKYSRRTGTRADRMPDQIPERIKNERSEIIRRISVENKRAFRRSLVGKEQIVLVEKVRGKTGWGYGELYVPVEFRHPEAKENMLRRVKLTGLGEGDDPVLLGKDEG
ncbi:MAG: 2-methylthioadenine synthetase [Bacteroides sp. SM23_62_1]|nr:MAG: 2-methylthioadenine synthetase [Bacteroides sp. SM23_62_1]